MTALKPSDFAEFFRAVYGYSPFPWQGRLAERVCGNAAVPGHWPRCIALPTAAGKTACIDVAVFALACQAVLAPEKRTAPRRIFFVVDRRVVVDQAYDHATALAETIDKAEDGPCWAIAETLRSLARPGWHELPEANRRRILGKRRTWSYKKEADWKPGDRTQFWNDLTDDERKWIDVSPLDVYALRGGMYRESAWVRSPLQPTVITSTVDQVGSRLLFRGYGVSDASKPLHAALVGNDSLILLDEAHCAVPFDQTMTLVRKYRAWAEDGHALPLPFHFVTMTATPTADTPEDQIERLQREDRTHAILGNRIAASKPARLVIAGMAKGAKWRDELVTVLVGQTKRLQIGDVRAVGVIVNRVATARDVASHLRSELGGAAEIILLTGRMRPVDRDAIMERLKPLLSKNSNDAQDIKPTFVVATQTIEVGADLDFHALVTECASLDALRQRFGRLNRVAARDKAEAVIVVRADQTEPATENADGDPVYGSRLAKTWQWLNEHASTVTPDPIDSASSADEPRAKKGRKKRKGSDTPASVSAAKFIDFGVAAMEKQLKDMTPEQIADLNAPASDAAVLLPAHLDMWCQTSPRPTPDPDPSYFLHGSQRGEPEIQVVFRGDLGQDEEDWAEVVSLCPPSSSESLPVRLRDFRRWLQCEGTDETSSDVEGERVEDSNGKDDKLSASTSVSRRALRWRGPVARETAVVDSRGPIAPNDVYVVPITSDDQRAVATLLGDFPAGDDRVPMVTDAGDLAFQRSRDRAILRLRHDVYPLLDASYNGLDPKQLEDDETDAKTAEALDALRKHPDESVRRAVKELGDKRHRTIKSHPVGGLVLIGKRRLHQFDPTFVEPEDSWEAASDRPYPLDQHCGDVAERAKQCAERCGLPDLAHAIGLAGLLHDAGKSEPRFQAWLHGGNRRRGDLFPRPLAKSCGRLLSRSERGAAREQAGYPAGGRHELASVRLAEGLDALPSELSEATRDLVLHLIASHHGFCRPFAPVVEDTRPEAFTFQHDGRTLAFTPDSSFSGHGLERLDSDVAERFWTLTRRYGWWGLPYLEALLRLADWTCSEPPEHSDSTPSNASSGAHAGVARITLSDQPPPSARPSLTPAGASVTLSGLDGSNPLAFLAALGVLRTLTRAWPDQTVKLSWSAHGGTWCPTLHIDIVADQQKLTQVLFGALVSDASKHSIAFMKKPEQARPPMGRKKGSGTKGDEDDDGVDGGSKGQADGSVIPRLFRDRADNATPTDRDGLDWLSAMAADLAPDATSQLQTARRDYFWGNLESVMRLTTANHIQRTLFQPWDYADPLDNQSLHIEPSEDRRHAHQWSKPSGDPDRKQRGAMLGANRLAIEAFPFFQSIAAGDKLATRGFSGNRADNTYWTWPLWSWPADLEVVASLLSLPELQSDPPETRALSARGVASVFRCRRILVGKTPNFSPATAV